MTETLRDELARQDVCSVAVFCKLFEDVLDRETTVLELNGLASDVPIVTALLAKLRNAASSETRRVALTPVPEMAAAVALAERQRAQSLQKLRQAFLDPVPIRTKRMILQSDGLTMVSRRRVTSQDSAADARGRAEDRKRDKWLQELRSLVVASRLPVATLAGNMPDPNLLLDRLGRGRRASIIRRRVIDWKAAARFFMFSFGVPWLRVCHR